MKLSEMTAAELRRLARKMGVSIPRKARRKADIIKALSAAEDERDPARGYSDAIIIGAIEGADGNISEAADNLGSSRTTVHDRINSVPEVQLAYLEAAAKANDEVRLRIMNVIKDPAHRDHGRMLMFWARAKMGEEFGETIGIDLVAFRHQLAVLEKAIDATLDDTTKKKLADALRREGFGILTS